MGTKLFVGIITVCIILVIFTRFSEQGSAPISVTSGDSPIVAEKGMHWHPKIAISIHGEDVPIPSNIGLIGGHSPMHTHETDGTIHLEFEGVVREDDIRLRRFFELWGKEFNNNQIFDNVNSEDGSVHMYVNGEENTEFENYLLQENDRIEIRYETEGEAESLGYG